MSNFSNEVISGPYDGILGEVSIYHMAIFDSSSFVKKFQEAGKIFETELGIRNFESDLACSWCIVESVKRAFPELRVFDHELNDTYEAVYDLFFIGEEYSLRHKLLPYLQTKSPIKLLKVMTMLERSVIAIGT